MNYGAEPADQVVRYSLEGMEYSLKITGNVAKHVAIFIAAALKDQKTVLYYKCIGWQWPNPLLWEYRTI